MNVEYVETEESQFMASLDRTLAVGIGQVIGDLKLSLYDDARFPAPTGTTLVRFSFLDADGTGRQYSASLHPLAFWPGPTDRVFLSERPNQRDFGFMSSLDDRTPFEIAVEGGPPLCGVRKYLGFEGRVFFAGSAVRVFARMNTEDPRAFQGLINFVYDVPVRRLLWRNASRPAGGELLIEDEPFVQIEEVSAPKGIPPSPIWLR
ncbi:MAG: hypothetical protein RIB58_08475 [Phycisphaerales bacterium]